MMGGQASSIGFVLYDTDLNSEQNAVFGKIDNGKNVIELGNKDVLINKMKTADSDNLSGDVATKITLILFVVYLILLVLLFFKYQNFAQLVSGSVFAIGSYFPLLGLILVNSRRYKNNEDMAQMRRYHACEHKAINMGKKENTLENMRKASMYEAECGTVYFGYELFYVSCLSIAILNFSSLGFVKLLIIMAVLAAVLFINILNPLNPFKILQKPMIATLHDTELMLGLEMRNRLYSND